MPLYEYLCGACGHRFERIQKFSDPPVSECPSCGARQVEKQLSSPAIQFKGSGWYITDYAKSGAGKTPADASPSAKTPADGAAAPAADGAGAAKTPTSSSDSTSASKPASQSDAKTK